MKVLKVLFILYTLPITWAAWAGEDAGFFGSHYTWADYTWEQLQIVLTGTGLAMIPMFIMWIPPIQRIVLPMFDELAALGKKALGEGLTPAEASMAVACAISTSIRILGIYILIAHFSTPMG